MLLHGANLRKIVYYLCPMNKSPMIRIEQSFLDDLKDKAKQSPRKRQHFNLHKDYDQLLQRFLNAVEPGSYIRPHNHISAGKTELFIVLNGRFLVIIFNEDGSILDHQVLKPFESPFAVEIPPEAYHTVLSLETGSVALEIKDGPFDPSAAKDFAAWAPEEYTPEAEQYLNELVFRTTGGQLAG
jgi:cupin fold WbuC family metalloprotein